MSEASQIIHNLLTQVIGLMNFLEDNDMSDARQRAIANSKLDGLKTNLEINSDQHHGVIEALASLQIHRNSHPDLSGWFEKLHNTHTKLSYWLEQDGDN